MLAALICGAALGLNNVDPSPHGVLSSQTASRTPPPSTPPPSPPPDGGQVDRRPAWGLKDVHARNDIAVVVCGLARTLNHNILMNNFRDSIVKPLQPDVFLAISHDDKTSPEHIEDEVKPFKEMLLTHGTGYVGWRRSKWPKLSDEEREKTCPDAGLQPQLSQWRTVRVALEMLEGRERGIGRQYKAVLRTRTDVIFERAFPPPDMLLRAIAPVELLVPWYSKRTGNGKRVMGDQVGLMQRQMADAYLDTFSGFACGPNGESRTHLRDWCNEVGWTPEAGECFLGSRVQGPGRPRCLSTFVDRMAEKKDHPSGWAFNMIAFCDDNSGFMCIKKNRGGHEETVRFRDGEPGWSFSVQEMNLTRMEEYWNQMRDSDEGFCNCDGSSNDCSNPQ